MMLRDWLNSMKEQVFGVYMAAKIKKWFVLWMDSVAETRQRQVEHMMKANGWRMWE